MKKVIMSLIALLLLATIFSGCSEKDVTQTSEESDETTDWKTEGFAVTGDVETKQGLWVTEYIPWKHENVIIDSEKEDLYFPANFPPSRVYGDKIYRLNTVINPPAFPGVRWIMEIYDTSTMTSAVKEFSYKQLEQPALGNYLLSAMDLVSEDSYVFQLEAWESSENMYHQTVNRMIYLNPEGEIHATDLWDIYLEKSIAVESLQSVLALGPGYCICDSAGNIYQKAKPSEHGYTQLFVLSRNGTVLLEYETAPLQVIEEPMRTESGELIYPVYDIKESCYHFIFPDIETGEIHSLGTMSASTRAIKQLFGMQGSLIYYETSEGIVSWNIKDGTRTLVFDYQENEIPRTYQTMLVLRSGQLPLLHLYRNGSEGIEDWLAPLSDQPVLRENVFRVADLTNNILGSKQVSECADLLSKKDMNHTFLYQSAVQDAAIDADAFRTQIIAELMAGNGPELLYVSRSDMALLQNLGLLADLKDLIPEETLADLWPGVISMGTLDGQLVGLPGNITAAQGLAVASDTWSESTWQLEDIITLMGEGRLENALYYPQSHFYFEPLGTAIWLIEYSLEDSFLIDWANRESHFEDERFIHLLEIVRSSQDVRPDDSENWFHGGKSIALFTFNSYTQVNNFDAIADKEDSNYVGFPTKGNSGNYLNTSGMLVVNVNAKDTKEVQAYLEYFLGDKIQDICEHHAEKTDPALSVRRFHADEIEQSPEGEYLWRGERLSVPEDGSTSLHRAISFLESCVPAPALHPDLMDIISEELDAYFSGDKSARQAAEIIDRRVQVYLDEGN